MALQSGEIDAAHGMLYASYPFRKMTPTPLPAAPPAGYLGAMNFESAIMRIRRKSRPLPWELTRKGFVETLLDGKRICGRGRLPGEFFLRGRCISAADCDPEGAKQLLADAGWVDTDGDGVRRRTVRS